MIPYLYTASYRTHHDGVALVEPLYYEWKNDAAYAYKNEYLFGGELLVAPVTTPAEEDGFARTKVWFPEGTWTDIFTGAEYEAGKEGKEVTVLREIESVPVFIKAGGVLPLSADEGNSVENPSTLEILVWSGNGGYTLYEDGATKEINGSLFTKFETKYEETDGCAKQMLLVSMQGDASVIPEDRVFKIRFKNIHDGQVRLYVDGQEVPTEELLTDCVGVDVAVQVGKEYRIEVDFAPQTPVKKLIEYARKNLIRAKGNIDNKTALWRQIAAVKSVDEYVMLVDATDKVSDTVKECLKEIL